MHISIYYHIFTKIKYNIIKEKLKGVHNNNSRLQTPTLPIFASNFTNQDIVGGRGFPLLRLSLISRTLKSVLPQ